MGFRRHAPGARVRVCTECRGIQPYGVARPLTAREHWRLGRAFGYRTCCITAFIVMVTLLNRFGWVGRRLLTVYHRVVARASDWRYLACPMCAWSDARVVQHPSCRCADMQLGV